MIDMIVDFLTAFKDCFIEVLPFLIIGFLLSGLIYEFVPTWAVEKHLGAKGIRPLIYAILAGAVLPICCIGALPVAVSLHQKKARLGPVLAFLVATPATSVTALLVCYAILGVEFAVFVFFAVVLMGLAMGAIGNSIRYELRVQPAVIVTDPVCGMNINTNKATKTEYQGENRYFCSPHCQSTFEKSPEKYVTEREYVKSAKERLGSALKFAFVDMVREIGPALLLGLVLTAVIVAVAPVGKFVGNYLGGGFGYLFSIAFGLIMYICSTASVPLVDAFISQGMNIGAGMVLLLAGPITSWSTILVLRREFGIKMLMSYLATISILSLFLGYCFSVVAD